MRRCFYNLFLISATIVGVIACISLSGCTEKHFIGLSDNVTYVVEDITDGEVDKYKYTLNFNPKMWFPFGADIID